MSGGRYPGEPVVFLASVGDDAYFIGRTTAMHQYLNQLAKTHDDVVLLATAEGGTELRDAMHAAFADMKLLGDGLFRFRNDTVAVTQFTWRAGRLIEKLTTPQQRERRRISDVWRHHLGMAPHPMIRTYEREAA